MEVKGLVKRVGEEEQVSSSFTKRELVVVTEEQYPQYISINFPQGKCNLELDGLKPNQRIAVSINLRGREWIDPKDNKAKYFNEIQGWRIVAEQSAAPTAQTPAPAAAQTAQPVAAAAANNINPDDTQGDLDF